MTRCGSSELSGPEINLTPQFRLAVYARRVHAAGETLTPFEIGDATEYSAVNIFNENLLRDPTSLAFFTSYFRKRVTIT